MADAIRAAGGEKEQQEPGRQTPKERREPLARRGCLVVQRREVRPKRQRGEHSDDSQCGQPRCPQATPFLRGELRGLPFAHFGAVTVPCPESRGDDALGDEPAQRGEHDGNRDA